MRKTQKSKDPQKEADKLLQEYVRTTFPRCEACGAKTQVGHHWIEKSRSNLLRYDLKNIIPLCNSCHTKIHNLFGSSVTGSLKIAEIIIKKRGEEWKKEMERLATKTVKTGRGYWLEQLGKVKEWINN